METDEEKMGSVKKKGGGGRKGGKTRGRGHDQGEGTFKYSLEHRFLTTNEVMHSKIYMFFLVSSM